MINRIWSFMIIFSFICAFITGKTDETVKALFDACTGSVSLIINITVIMCFWSGILNIAKECKITDFTAKLLSGTVRLITKNNPSKELKTYISSNIAANLLGLGNAATPYALSAMKIMDKNLNSAAASDEMCRFIILNTASIQLLPTTVFALRQNAGSGDVFCVLIPIWICSFATAVFAMTLCRIFELFKSNQTIAKKEC